MVVRAEAVARDEDRRDAREEGDQDRRREGRRVAAGGGRDDVGAPDRVDEDRDPHAEDRNGRPERLPVHPHHAARRLHCKLRSAHGPSFQHNSAVREARHASV